MFEFWSELVEQAFWKCGNSMEAPGCSEFEMADSLNGDVWCFKTNFIFFKNCLEIGDANFPNWILPVRHKNEWFFKPESIPENVLNFYAQK